MSDESDAMTFDDPIPFAVHHPGADPCGTYAPGHDPHWIQVLRVAPRGVPRPVHDVRLLDATTVELDVDLVDGAVDGAQWETVVRRNHDAVRLHRAWEGTQEGRLISGASLLQLGPASGAATFSVAAGPLGRCGSRA